MRARATSFLVAAAVVAGAIAVACVDLFHSTDFQTFCTTNPSDPVCGGPGVDAGDGATSDAKPPRPDFCTFTSAQAKTRAEHACAWLGACEGPLGTTKLATCVALAQLALDCTANPSLRPEAAVADLWGCLAETKTCADVDACVFPGGVQPCKSSAGGTFTACGSDTNANVLVECGTTSTGRPTGVDPCLLRGRTCVRRNDTVAECTGAGQDHCAGAAKCQGTSAIVCGTGADSTIDLGLDCASFGAGRCVVAGAAPACAPAADAGPCTTDAGVGATSCDGALARTCVDGREIVIACATLGAPCQADAGVAHLAESPCVETSAPCTTDDSCLGATVVSCSGGVERTVDCGAHGLGACRVAPNGLAQCTPK